MGYRNPFEGMMGDNPYRGLGTPGTQSGWQNNVTQGNVTDNVIKEKAETADTNKLLGGLGGLASIMGQGGRNDAIMGAIGANQNIMNQALGDVRDNPSLNTVNGGFSDTAGFGNYQEILNNPEGLALYSSLMEAADRKTERNAARSGYQGNTGRLQDE